MQKGGGGGGVVCWCVMVVGGGGNGVSRKLSAQRRGAEEGMREGMRERRAGARAPTVGTPPARGAVPALGIVQGRRRTSRTAICCATSLSSAVASTNCRLRPLRGRRTGVVAGQLTASTI